MQFGKGMTEKVRAHRHRSSIGNDGRQAEIRRLCVVLQWSRIAHGLALIGEEPDLHEWTVQDAEQQP